MMNKMTSALKTYTELFEYKTLTPIVGKPTVDNLIVIFQQLKRNAQKIPSHLGGGKLGYLGLVLKGTVYNAMPTASPFSRPTEPGPFTASNGRLTVAEIAEEKALHEEEQKRYAECNTVDQLLRNQLVEAIPNTYLDTMRNEDTDMINDPIPDIIDFLVKNYCNVSPRNFNERENELKSTVYNPDEHVNIVFNKIKRFQTLCQLIGKTRADDQWVDIGYLIFAKSTLFQETMITWNAKTTANSYTDFKAHITNRYHALDEVGGLTIQDSSLNLVQTLTAHQNKLTSALKDELNQTLQVNFMDAVRNLQSANESYAAIYDQENIPPVVNANAVTTDPAILQLLKKMEAKITCLEAAASNKASVINPETNTRTGQPYKRYCWMHGCCTHWGKKCPNKAAGHQDDATFKNRKNGSGKDCFPVL